MPGHGVMSSQEMVYNEARRRQARLMLGVLQEKPLKTHRHSRSRCTAKPQGALVLAVAQLGVVEQAAASVDFRWWALGEHSFDCQMALVCARLCACAVKNDVWFGYGSRTGRTAFQNYLMIHRTTSLF